MEQRKESKKRVLNNLKEREIQIQKKKKKKKKKETK